MYRLLLAVLCFFSFNLQAQHVDAGLLLGTSTYQGDLSPETVNSIVQELNPAGGLFVRYNLNDFFAAKLSGTYGQLSGSDENFPEDDRQRLRNLSFKSYLLEVGLTAEFNILGYQPYALQRIFSPYLFGGMAYYQYNPKALYEGEWVELQRLGTEGQGLAIYPERKLYSLSQFAIPFGVGVKFAINDSWNLGLEVGSRLLFNDYIDDVSLSYPDPVELLAARGELALALSDRRLHDDPASTTSTETIGRGNDKARDWYYIVGLSISYNFLDNGLVGSRNRRKGGKNGCFDF